VSGLNGLHWIEHAQGFTSSIWSYMLVFIALVACNSFFDCAIAFYYISDSLNMGCWDGNQTRVTPGILTSFQYMATSRVHDKAHVNSILSDHGPREFYLYSNGNCLTTGHSCACMSASSFGFTYMEGGLLKDTFLQ
jgi:hypothetical protein